MMSPIILRPKDLQITLIYIDIDPPLWQTTVYKECNKFKTITRFCFTLHVFSEACIVLHPLMRIRIMLIKPWAMLQNLGKYTGETPHCSESSIYITAFAAVKAGFTTFPTLCKNHLKGLVNVLVKQVSKELISEDGKRTSNSNCTSCMGTRSPVSLAKLSPGSKPRAKWQSVVLVFTSKSDPRCCFNFICNCPSYY